MCLFKGARFADGDPRGLFDRVAVDAGGDCREGDATEGVLIGELEGVAVARGERVRFAVGAALPNGAHAVDHMTGFQAIAAGELCLPGVGAAQGPAFLEQLGAGAAVDGPVDTATAEERGVGGVHDGVDVEQGDVALDHLDHVLLPLRSSTSDSPITCSVRPGGEGAMFSST